MERERRWTVRDRQGNSIYLTDERWAHILEGHPEMALHEESLRMAVRSGARRQDSLNPQKYRYVQAFRALPEYNTHIEAVVLFRYDEGTDGKAQPNNYIVTAYQKQIG
jgi:hypothetical protein